MKFLIGIVVVFVMVLVPYALHGGHVGVLWQPSEFVIILGAAIGAFIIRNSGTVIKGVVGNLGRLFKGEKHGKDDYMELFAMLNGLFKAARGPGGVASVEKAIGAPHESDLFKHYESFLHDHAALDFICDYYRMMVISQYPPHVIEDLMDKDIESHHHDYHVIADALGNLSESLPALGIVAAVLGVIHTMGSINEPPEILGGLIGAALVGTFFGVLASYAIFGPMSGYLTQMFDSDTAYLKAIQTAMVANLRNYAPLISLEFARKTLPHHVRPTFEELEGALQGK